MILSQYSLKLWNDICHFTLDEFYLDSGHKETPLWSPCMQIRSPGPPQNVKMLKKISNFHIKIAKIRLPLPAYPPIVLLNLLE